MLRIIIVIISIPVIYLIIFILFLLRTLNLSGITVQIHTVAIFLFVDLETIFNAEFTDMLIIYDY
jgi:hypothetical protein